ncbi:MAG: methenyltetrahydromethanopterin cyclohydrolase [Asgard group archaeon]|nr:methenyltetrahydromethanopterin cyclohydrolase [Asgard group archaeon]
MVENISLTKGAMPFVKKLMDNATKYGINVLKINDATIIDCGIEAKGSIDAGILFSKISLGGLAKVQLQFPKINDEISLLQVQVSTSYPVLATIGCQAASWNISKGDFFGMVCGPGRALAQKPTKSYKLLDYKEESDKAILCIESDKLPSDKIIDYLADKCQVEKKEIIILMIKTACLVEYIQMAARAIELGVFRLVEQLGYPKERILHAVGIGIVPPLSKDNDVSNDRVNNGLIYGTKLFLIIESQEDDNLTDLILKIPSKSSSSFGKLFIEVFNEAGKDFANFDLTLLAPTEIIINDIRTGKIYYEGKIQPDKIIK